MMTLADARHKDAQRIRAKLKLMSDDLEQLAGAVTSTLARHDLIQAASEINVARATLTDAIRELRREAGQ